MLESQYEKATHPLFISTRKLKGLVYIYGNQTRIPKLENPLVFYQADQTPVCTEH